ncbi:MAG: glycosyltransferase family 4 protein [Pseudomonadota bacterium]|nr:glycosyltransferase family 4 protein [Pseudomonadota bacterium]
MLRLCVVNPFESEGGAEYQISLLIDALAARTRWEIHYLTHFVADEKKARNYQVSRIGSGGRVPRFGYVMEAAALYRKLREIGPAVIYQRVACGYTGVCAYYSRKRSVPLIWHVAHDTDVTSQLLDSGRNILRLRLEKEAVKYGARNATAIVVQTGVQAELLQKNYGRQATAVIPNFQPCASEVIDKSGPLTIVWIANFKRWKRPEVFVRLARHFDTRADVRFVMVGAAAQGSGDASWQKSLMDSIQGTAHLQYWGKRSQADVNELLGRAHILVNTSVHEGFPNTFIQAWMREVAVVSLSVDPDGVLQRERIGIAAHSEEGLVAAIRCLVEEPELLATYAKCGRNYAALNHSLRNADRLASLIESYALGGCG